MTCPSCCTYLIPLQETNIYYCHHCSTYFFLTRLGCLQQIPPPELNLVQSISPVHIT
jgi:hypothetical protein